MRRIVLAAVVLFATSFVQSRECLAALVAGDVAIIGARSDDSALGTGSDDGLAWLALVDLAAGQELTFTDLGWASDGSGFFGNEGAIRYTVGAGGIAAGTTLQLDWVRTGSGTSGTAYEFIQSNSTGADLGTYANANVVGEAGMLFATSGDNLFVFDGTDRAAPNFLYGFRNEGGAWQDPAGPGTVNDDNDDSALPASLVNANTALGIAPTTNFDNARYTGPTSGTRDEILAALQNTTNWEVSNNVGQFGNDLTNGLINSGGSFNITAVPEPGSLALLGVAGLGLVLRRRRS